MDVTITVRRCEVPERFRRHLEEKVSKVQQLSPRARRVAAVVTHEPNPRLASVAYCIELTVHGDDPVVRAEARADEPYAALDIAFAKVVERLRRLHDRKVVRTRHGAPSAAVPGLTASVSLDPASSGAGPDSPVDAVDRTVTSPEEIPSEEEWADGTSPISIREKRHQAVPMDLDRALYEMELVGHDFFLFVDSDTGLPSVVYRRKGWSYGVIRLESPDGAVPRARVPALAE